MASYTRREFALLLAAGLPVSMAAAQLRESRIRGVRIGVMNFSFRDLPKGPDSDRVDGIIAAMTALGLYECEVQPSDLTPGRLTPARGGGAPPAGTPSTQAASQPGSPRGGGAANPAVRQWWAETPLDHFVAIRRKFTAAGINVYCFQGNAGQTDEELNRDFDIAKALGARFKGRPTGLDAIRRMAVVAERHDMPIYVHNEGGAVTEANLVAAMDVSPFVRINFDVGHYTLTGSDPVQFIDKYHERITHLHLKDRKKAGDNVILGQGDTPVKEILWLLRDKKYDIPAFIENEVPGESGIEGTRKCMSYIKQVLS
jgi:sugar phosphate isomerase/epimerase